MKIYEKPTLVMMSIYSNDLLCNSCVTDVKGGNISEGILESIEIAGANAFSSDEGCSVEISGYCKFTGSNTIINS